MFPPYVLTIWLLLYNNHNHIVSVLYGELGPLVAEICWRVWGTTTNFNGIRILAALLHGTVVEGISQTAALNRGRHLYSAGRPLRWAVAHISS